LADTPDTAFADSLAAAAALEPRASTELAPVLEDVSDEQPEDESGEEPESPVAGEDDGIGDDEGEDSADDAEASGISAAKELFLSGDKTGALKALGLDPKILDLNDAKFRTMRQGIKAADEKLAEATRLHAEATAKEAQNAEMYERGRKELGPVLQLQRLLAKGDYLAAKDLLEALAPAGTTYQQIAEGIALAAKGMSPSEQLYRRRLRELDEREQAARQEPEKKPDAPKPDPAKNIEGAKKALAGTALADIPGAAEKLVSVAAEHWDPVKKGLKLPRAELIKLVQKDPVISQLLELKQLKAKKGKAPEPEPEVKRDPKGRFRERPRVESKLTPEQQRKAKEEADFKASVAQAAAMERQARRAAGAGKGRR
jgi:hypothetical protein